MIWLDRMSERVVFLVGRGRPFELFGENRRAVVLSVIEGYLVRVEIVKVCIAITIIERV